jgi:diphthamide synthase subunit DPH2
MTSACCLHNFVIRQLESHVHFANRCAPWKIANGAEYFVLQALQLNLMGIRRKFTGGTSVSHHRSNESFVEDQFNISS